MREEKEDHGMRKMRGEKKNQGKTTTKKEKQQIQKLMSVSFTRVFLESLHQRKIGDITDLLVDEASSPSS